MTINYSKQVLLKRGNSFVSSTYIGPLGEVTVDTDFATIRVHDGVTPGGHLSTSSASGANPPSNPRESSLWYDTVGGRLYVYFDGAWVDASPAGDLLLNANVAALASAVANVEVHITFLDASIGSFENQVTSQNIDFQNLVVGDIQALDANIGTFETTVTGTVNTINANINTLNETIIGFEGNAGPTSAAWTSDNPPMITNVGALWYDDVSGRLYVRYDGTWVDASPMVTTNGGAPDGGLADNTVAITIDSYSLQTDLGQYDLSGYVSYTIHSADIAGIPVATGIIIKGLTVDYTQTIDGAVGSDSVTVSWNEYGITGALWEQVVSVTAFVTDSRGYTFYAVVTDMYEVPHGPCLVEGTQVTMADGTRKAIEDIKHGELVRVWNFDLGEFSEAIPLWIKVGEETDQHDVYTFSDGTKLRTVGHHVFNKQAGAFTKLKHKETPIGTITFNEHGEEVTLLSKERITAPTRYYNVWTQYHLNLFANGILTSNRFNNIYPIVDMKFVKDDRQLRSVDEFVGIDAKYIAGLRLQEQEYTAEYISNYVHNRLERLDIANTVEQGI